MNWLNEEWYDEESGAKKGEMLDQYLDSLINMPVTVISMEITNYPDLINENKDALKLYVHYLQYFFGVDNIYRMNKAEFIVVSNTKDMTMKNLQEWMRMIRQNEKERQAVPAVFKIGYVYGHGINKEELIDMIYVATRQRILSETDQPLGVNYYQQLYITEDNIERFYQDTVDDVTGLLLKKDFLFLAKELLKRASYQDNDVMILCLNILNFSIYNDKYGYKEGNLLLKNIGQQLRHLFPKCLISRFNSDQFYIMTHDEETEDHLYDLRGYLKDNEKNANLDLRCGIFTFNKDDREDIQQDCDRAAAATADIHDKNQLIRYYDRSFSGKIEHTRYVVENIDKAIENNYIKVYLQPVVRTLTGKMCSMEALARWDDPQYGLLSPGIFIPALEDYHLIHKLDIYMLKNICKAYRYRSDHHLPLLPVSFNLSRLDFDLCDIFTIVEDIVYKYEVPKNMIHIEVTESVIADDPEQMFKKLNRFKNAGYEIWLDDFGSGYSSLNVLKDFDFDELKIDMKFLSTFTPKSREVIRSVVNMAKELGVQTLAEGVETKAQYDFLSAIGCEKVQGYYFSKPVPADEVFDIMTNKGVAYEILSNIDYLNAIGHVNFLSMQPFRQQYETATTQLPLAIVEYEDHAFHFMKWTKSFIETLQTLNVTTIEDCERNLNDEKEIMHNQLIVVAEKLRYQEESENVDYIVNDFIIRITAKNIAASQQRAALLIYIENITESDVYKVNNRLKDNLFNIYKFYEDIYLVDLNKKTISTIYANSFYEQFKDGGDFEELINGFKKDEVYIDDQDRFQEFTDLKTIKDKLIQSKEHVLSCFVRTRLYKGTYHWVEISVAFASKDENDLFIYIRPLNIDSTREFLKIIGSSSREGEITSEDLFEAIKHTDTMIFWKDRQRRFKGVNKAFMDYYGLSSEDEIIGKTDEEMGWHIDPLPFKEDEQNVLENGKTIKDVHGQCIVKGEVRNIFVNKRPIYDAKGDIVGLIGTFMDANAVDERCDELSDSIYKDDMTHTFNVYGMNAIAKRYVDVAKYQHLDFGALLIRIKHFEHYVAVNGKEKGAAILRKTAAIIKECAPNTNIGHLNDATFVILKQTDHASELAAYANKISEELRQVTDVNGSQVTIYFSTSITLYSETDDFIEMKNLAIERLAG